uniref:BPI2 domain-containing protein n=1 Tax=Panagrellus redivivus TaxID=6233 RepID=A0A7E4VMC3_PANRE
MIAGSSVRRKNVMTPIVMANGSSVSLFIKFLLFLSLLASVRAQSLANSFFTEPDTYAGFTSRVNQKGFDLLAEYLKQRVSKFMQFGEVTYNVSLPLTPSVSLRIIAQRIDAFDASNFRSALKPLVGREIHWQGTNLKTTIRSVYRIISAGGEVTGTVPITFDKMSIDMGLLSGINSDGHLKTDMNKCKITVGDLIFAFSPNDAQLLQNYMPFIQRSIRENVDQLLCPSFHTEIVPVVSNRLLNTPMSSALFDHYFINYGLIGPIKYNADSVELQHRGNVFGILRQGRTRLNDFRLPFRSAPLTSVSDSKHMVTFQMSNYTIASLLYWMDQYRKFDYEISQSSVNDSNIAGYLRTECPTGEICAGTLFPALSTRFASGAVNIKTHTVSFPHVRLDNGKVVVIVDSRIDAFVQQSDKNRRFLTATMLAEVTLSNLAFKDYKLTGKLTIDSFKISDVISLVDGIDEGSLEFLINALNELLIAEDMATKLKDGIKLPIIFDFQQTGSEIKAEKDRLTIGADYCFDESCTKIEKNQDANADYYDVVQGADGH